MNRYARNILAEFTSAENKEYLRSSILQHFNGDPTVTKFLSLNFGKLVENFAESIEQELFLSDPLPGTTIFDQVTCFNNQFLEDRIGLITTHVGKEETVSKFTVTDGLATSRHGINHYRKNCDQILDSWGQNSGRGVQAREDTGADVYKNNPYNNGGLNTGIVFCDQSEIGMQRHQDMFFGGTYMQTLNRTDHPHELTPFGVSTPEADARLLSRKTFRKNEAGVENGIMRYEARLYNRNLERDINEGLRGPERDCMVHAHDMTSLYNRIDHKNEARRKYVSTSPRMELQTNNMHLLGDMQYS